MVLNDDVIDFYYIGWNDENKSGVIHSHTIEMFNQALDWALKK